MVCSVGLWRALARFWPAEGHALGVRSAVAVELAMGATASTAAAQASRKRKRRIRFSSAFGEFGPRKQTRQRVGRRWPGRACRRGVVRQSQHERGANVHSGMDGDGAVVAELRDCRLAPSVGIRPG